MKYKLMEDCPGWHLYGVYCSIKVAYLQIAMTFPEWIHASQYARVPYGCSGDRDYWRDVNGAPT